MWVFGGHDGTNILADAWSSSNGIKWGSETSLPSARTQHAGTVFNRETVLNRVWGYNYYGGSRTVDVHIRRLRSKLDDSRFDYIETVRNVGYRFAQSLR